MRKRPLLLLTNIAEFFSFFLSANAPAVSKEKNEGLFESLVVKGNGGKKDANRSILHASGFILFFSECQHKNSKSCRVKHKKGRSHQLLSSVLFWSLFVLPNVVLQDPPSRLTKNSIFLAETGANWQTSGLKPKKFLCTRKLMRLRVKNLTFKKWKFGWR